MSRGLGDALGNSAERWVTQEGVFGWFLAKFLDGFGFEVFGIVLGWFWVVFVWF